MLRDEASVMSILDLLLRCVCANNTPQHPMLLEPLALLARVAPVVLPCGPLFAFHTNAVAWPPEAPERVRRYWEETRAAVERLPQDADTAALRDLCAAAAVGQAAAAAERGAYACATQVCARALAFRPATAEPYAFSARLLIRGAHFDAAAAVARQFLKECPQDPEARALLDECAAAQTRQARIAVLTAVLASNAPGLSERIELAGLYQQAGDTNAAGILAGQALSAGSNTAAALEQLITLYTRLGDLDALALCLERLTLLAPESFSHWTRRAAVAYERDRPDQAVEYLQRAALVDRPRLRRMLRTSGVLEDMRTAGRTNDVRVLEQLIAE